MSRILLGVLISALAAGTTAAQADSLPAGVTQEMVTLGQTLFRGQGICMSCHGQNGEGMPNLGPNLGDDEWIHGDGSFEQIVARIVAGVPADSSRSGMIMPPRGGSALTDEQVRAVAAYVWTLRRRR